MRRFLSPVIFFLLLLTFTAGCGRRSPPEVSGKLRIATTVGMIGDAVGQVGGRHVKVTSLMGPGVDPHLYKPSAGDIATLEDADVVFYGGLHLEGQMVAVFESLAARKKVVAVSRDIDRSQLRAVAGANDTFDPHIWFDVMLWTDTVRTISTILAEVDPKNAAEYEEAADVYIAQLELLDSWVEEQMNTIPIEQRVLITSHDAFGYFGAAYGLEVLALQGISTSSEYSLQDIERIINIVVEKKIPAIFVESSVSQKSIEAVKEGVQARGHEVMIGGQLYSDAMGDPATAAGTYVGMVEANVSTISHALQEKL